MPYITQHDRQLIAVGDPPATPGLLNYALTQKVDDYLKRRGVSYGALNEVVGVLECVKMELYRRIAAPYEDKKCAENGDVYRPEHVGK